MSPAQLKQILTGLIRAWENEIIEFKETSDNFDTDKIGRYFSALANEANLRKRTFGWLVLGVRNRTRSVVGTNYRCDPGRLQSLKQQISSDTQPKITFRNIYELDHEDGRVVMMEIPPAPTGMPIAWKGHYYARAGESLSPLGLNKQDEIRHQTIKTDWSAQILSDASLADLDEAACAHARDAFAQKHANRFQASDVASWTLATLLDRAKVTQSGKITRTALLLLGKPEAAHMLSPHPAQMTWKLDGPERAYDHFGPPFLLNTTQIYQRIRNHKLRILPQDELLPIEVEKYDQKIVLEALHNCIAHQNYNQNARVTVVEQPNRLMFENKGGFFEGAPDDYLEGSGTPQRYRNPFLAQAMVELNMIDTMGYGIHDMYTRQAKRYLPMPDYDLNESGAVKLTIYGSVVDPAYSRLLIQKTDIPLADILALDRVQKKLPIPKEAAKRLRRGQLIEGRRPNFYVSATVAIATANKADYIHTRAQDDAFYAQLLTDYLEQFGEANRIDINKLLLPKLSDSLSEEQKTNKINNLITKWRRNNRIVNRGSSRAPQWMLAEKKGSND